MAVDDLKDKRVGVLMGGLSDEREISLKSGQAVLNALLAEGVDAVEIDAGRQVAQQLLEENVEVAFIALHGPYGEDGGMQGLLEVLGLPYTGSGVLASALAMDKAASKVFFRAAGIPTPDSVVLKAGATQSTELDLPLPVIIKPLRQGSSIGMTVVREDGDSAAAVAIAIDEAFKYDSAVLVESFITGRELTLSILDERVFPIVEIKPKNGIYDYDAKYVKGMTEFTVPARLDAGTEQEVVRLGRAAYDTLGCSGAARVDFMLDDVTGTPYVIEVNTIPGMTEFSLLPMAARSVGMDYGELCCEMLLRAGTGASAGAEAGGGR